MKQEALQGQLAGQRQAAHLQVIEQRQSSFLLDFLDIKDEHGLQYTREEAEEERERLEKELEERS